MRPQFVVRLTAASAALTMLVACSSAPATATTGAGQASLLQQVASDFGLAGFSNCDEVLDFLQTNALDQVTAWGLNGGIWPMLGRMEGDVMAAAQDSNTGGGANYSTTNLQEIGVDEADIVKTNGDLLLALSGNRLHVVDVSGEAKLLASLDLGELSPTGLFLTGSRALVVGSSWSDVKPLAGEEMPIGRMAPEIWPGFNALRIVEIDLSDPTDPQTAASVTMTGSLLASRMVGDSLRVVVSSLPATLPFVTPDVVMAQWPVNQQQHPAAWQRAERLALTTNRSVITGSTIDDWLNPLVVEGADGTIRTSQPDCASLARPTEFSGLGLTSVLTFDSDLSLTDQFGLVSDSQTVYATADNVFVATQQWRDWAGVPEDQWGQVAGITTTEIHRFDVSDPSTIEYRGSGEVVGWLYSQWALSEDDGYLRVASTNQSPFWGQVGSTQSMVTVLELGEESMEQAGFVAGLGRDENIYAVRFVGDQGYVVTYRQVDPLYVIDLSDPADPQVAGELKIPGYSAYLHPVSEGMLLGVGQDGDLDGRTLGTQVALFDVTDPENPRQIDKITFPGAYSGAEWDHHAFLYWPETDDTGLMVIPLQGQNGDQWWNGSVAIEVDGSRLGATEKLTQDGYVLRNLIVDNQLLTVSDLGVQGYDLGSYDETDWVSFS